MTLKLVKICGLKIKSERKVYLSEFEMNCKYECDGNNQDCESYLPMKIDGSHYITIREKIKSRGLNNDTG